METVLALARHSRFGVQRRTLLYRLHKFSLRKTAFTGAALQVPKNFISREFAKWKLVADGQAVVSIKSCFPVRGIYSSLLSVRRTSVSFLGVGRTLRLNSFFCSFMLTGYAHSTLRRRGIFAPLKTTVRRNILPPDRESPEYE